MKNTLFIALAACFLLLGCSKKSGSSVALNVKVSSGKAAAISTQRNPLEIMPEFLRAAGDIGANTAAQLTSLKYVFGFISVCESLTISGSGFQNPTNCIRIYNGPVVGDGSSSAITPANLASYASNQIDLMSATSLSTINQSHALTSDDAHGYNYAVMNWYTPIAVTGCANAANGVVCTQSTGASYSGGTTTTTANLTTASLATAQEAIVVSANGGSFFKFQKPFTITSADVTAGTAFTIDLVFNPDSVLTGRRDNNADGNLHGSVGSMYVPMLNIAPVPRKGTQTTKKETYLTTGNCPATYAKYRVELYYNSDDSTSILGATGGFVPDSTTTSLPIAQSDIGAKVIEIATAADSTISLKTPSLSGTQNWISGLTRKANGSLTMYSDFNGGTPISCPYTFVGTFDI